MQRDSLVTFLIRVPVILFSFLYSIFLIRMLGPEGNGLYSFLMASIGLSILIFGLDASKSTLYHVAHREFDTGKVIGFSFLVFGGSSILVAIILLILYLFQNPLSYFFIPKEYFNLFYVMFFVGSFICQHFTKLFTIIILGHKAFMSYNFYVLASSLLQVILYGGGYLAVTLLMDERDYRDLFLFILATQLIILFIAWYLYAKTFKEKVRTDTKEIQRDYIRYAGMSSFNQVGHFLNKRIDVWFIELFTGIKNLGIYALASQMTNFLLLFVDPLEEVLKPYLIDMEREKGNIVFVQYFRLIFYLITILCIILFLCSPWIIPLFFGQDFIGAVVPLKILSIGIIFVSWKRMFITYNRAYNDLTINIWAQWAGVVITIILDVILIPQYGIIGAAWASIFAYLTTALILAIDIKIKHGIRINELFILKSGDLKFLISVVNNYLKKPS